MNKILTKGPWFVSCHFLYVRCWESKPVPAESKLAITAVWIRLPQLPTKFYHKAILEQVGNRIEKLLKIDICTSSTLGGRYDRICIQVPLEILVATIIIIGTHNQPILYEGEGILCKDCGQIGYTLRNCSFMDKPKDPNNKLEPINTSTGEATVHNGDSQWRIVSFRRNK